MANKSGMGMVMVRNCNHFGWGPAYALTHLEDNDDLVLGNITQVTSCYSSDPPESSPHPHLIARFLT